MNAVIVIMWKIVIAIIITITMITTITTVMIKMMNKCKYLIVMMIMRKMLKTPTTFLLQGRRNTQPRSHLIFHYHYFEEKNTHQNKHTERKKITFTRNKQTNAPIHTEIKKKKTHNILMIYSITFLYKNPPNQWTPWLAKCIDSFYK